MMSRPTRTRRVLVLGTLAVPVAAPARSTPVPAEVATELREPLLRGDGRLDVLGLRIYDARLWVEPGFEPTRYAELPLAIEVTYARTLYGHLIAERSLAEMRRFGAIDPVQGDRWLAAMQRTFPDVARGDRITGVQHPGEAARFFVNGGLRGELREADFARRFFAIWLAPQTSEPALRKALLGRAGDRR